MKYLLSWIGGEFIYVIISCWYITVYWVSFSSDSSDSNDNITIFNATRFDNAHIFYVIVSNTWGLILLCLKLFFILKPILDIEYCGKYIIKSCERKTNRLLEIVALSSVEIEKQKMKQHYYVSTINDQITNMGPMNIHNMNMNMVTPTDRETVYLQSPVSPTPWTRAGSGGSTVNAVAHHSHNNTLTAVTPVTSVAGAAGAAGVTTAHSKNNPSSVRFDATNLMQKLRNDRNDTNTGSLSINVQHVASKVMMNSSHENNDNSDNKESTSNSNNNNNNNNINNGSRQGSSENKENGGDIIDRGNTVHSVGTGGISSTRTSAAATLNDSTIRRIETPASYEQIQSRGVSGASNMTNMTTMIHMNENDNENDNNDENCNENGVNGVNGVNVDEEDEEENIHRLHDIASGKSGKTGKFTTFATENIPSLPAESVKFGESVSMGRHVFPQSSISYQQWPSRHGTREYFMANEANIGNSEYQSSLEWHWRLIKEISLDMKCHGLCCKLFDIQMSYTNFVRFAALLVLIRLASLMWT